MKKILFLIVCAVACAFNSKADDGTSMTPIMQRANELVQILEDDKDQEIVRMEFDILTTTKSTYRNLSASWTYSIVAFGDYRFQDIDVKVYRKTSSGQWKEVASDDDESSIALVSVSPKTDGEYRIDITAFSFTEGYSGGHYGLIVCHDAP